MSHLYVSFKYSKGLFQEYSVIVISSYSKQASLFSHCYSELDETHEKLVEPRMLELLVQTRAQVSVPHSSMHCLHQKGKQLFLQSFA